MNTSSHTGGCQCGAVRFRAHGRLQATICHCRMCQKAFGAYYAPLVEVKDGGVEWTRGKPSHFRSSDVVSRGFCERCGTPLSYEAPDGIALAAGAFDDPSLLPPVLQYGVEAKIGFVDRLHQLPQHVTMDDIDSAPFLSDIVSRQHPDHDTDRWPKE